MESNQYEVIIIGGSYAGLAAAMALGRSLRKVLVIDAGKPCNRQTPHSHNFLTQDGKTPFEISSVSRAQVEAYKTISFYSDTVISASKSDPGFLIKTNDGSTFTGLKLIFATGIKDILPEIPGIQECWGISVIHCPYCHGYEVRNEKTGILANGDFGFEFGKMITNWTKDLTLYTNGKSALTSEQSEKLTYKNVTISEKKISQIIHQDGKIQSLVFEDGSQEKINALYAKPDFEQSSPLISELACALKENGYVEIDQFHNTNVPGIYACGDHTNMFRSVAFAVSSGTMAGAACNKELIDENF